MYVYTPEYPGTYVDVCTYVSVYMYLYIRIYVYVCVCVYMCMYVYVCLYIGVCVYVCVYTSACMSESLYALTCTWEGCMRFHVLQKYLSIFREFTVAVLSPVAVQQSLL